MKAVVRYSQRAGRFGRDSRDELVPAADTSTAMETNDPGKRLEPSGYLVDPSAVAAAIIDRLVAGRILRRH
jgi:hypothetical protein